MIGGRRSSRVTWIAWLSAELLALSAGSAAAQPFAVGHRRVQYIDPTRQSRSIPTEVYYPAETGGDDVPCATGSFPVVAFGHGYVITVDDYAFLWEGLVPSGYIVALPDTEGGLFPDHLDLGKDLAFLVSKTLEEGANPGSFLYQHVAAASAVSGHSMGGGASLLAVPENPAITAVANLAAAETDPSAIDAARSITVPALLFSGSLDCVTPPAQHQIPMYEALATDCKTWVSVTGGSHCQFAEDNFYCNLGEGGCPDPAISRAAQHALTLALLIPWFDAVLKEDQAAWTRFQDLIAQGQGIASLQDCRLARIDTLPVTSGGRGAATLDACPNPFRDRLEIRLTAPALAIDVLDATGRRIRTLEPGPCVVWDGRDDLGRDAAAGVCFLRVRGGATTLVRPVLRVR